MGWSRLAAIPIDTSCDLPLAVRRYPEKPSVAFGLRRSDAQHHVEPTLTGCTKRALQPTSRGRSLSFGCVTEPRPTMRYQVDAE